MRPMIFVCLLIALAAPAYAQPAGSQTVNVDEVWTTAAAQPDPGEQKRATIQRVLDHPATRELASEHHLDLDAALRALPALDGADLDAIYDRAAAVEQGLAGGDRVVISTTVIIIVLLVVILLLVAD
jgi:hypothetical protein